jgi:hypothetical protein
MELLGEVASSRAMDKLLTFVERRRHPDSGETLCIRYIESTTLRLFAHSAA